MSIHQLLPTRQIHLDFHTSEHVPGVGSRFSKENFQEALRLGHVNSVTLFARCHHGWCYYPTTVGKMHPTLSFDLTGAMMDACHEIGVRAPIYLTNGWFAQEALEHPDWVARNRDGTPLSMNLDIHAGPDEVRPGCSWLEACPGTGYADYQYRLIEEICARYPRVDGFFLDINTFSTCFCNACVANMRREGMDPTDDKMADAFAQRTWMTFLEKAHTLIKSHHPDATVFFNHCANPYTPERYPWQTHFELEDMPTVWEGYDRIPFRTKFFSKVGKDFVGQTGKFHKVWGEFGTYKNPNALLYECATISSFGAKVNVGDQLHPSGEMNLDSYRLIGKVFSYVESIEPWCYGGKSTSRLGMVLGGDKEADLGLSKMLLENQMDFDIVTEDEDLSCYDVILLPDAVTLDDARAARFNAFVANGGGLLMTGRSGLNKAETRFAIDVGGVYEGHSTDDDDFLQVAPEVLTSLNASIRQRGVVKEEIPGQPFLFYTASELARATDGIVLATLLQPYFTRRYGHYCGHLNTPYRPEDLQKKQDNKAFPVSQDAPAHPERQLYAGALQKGRVIWLGHPICKLYNNHGTQLHRDWFIAVLKRLYREPVLEIDTPSAARVNLVKQESENRYVLHVTYASPIQRGEVRVIEDMVPLYEVPVRIRITEPVKRAYLAPQNEDVSYVQEKGLVHLKIPKVLCHQILVLDT